MYTLRLDSREHYQYIILLLSEGNSCRIIQLNLAEIRLTDFGLLSSVLIYFINIIIYLLSLFICLFKKKYNYIIAILYSLLF